MDEIARYNMQRWQALVNAEALFTRPKLNLDAESAQEWLDPSGELGNLQGKQVLCLASGGGQQSVGYALLGAIVTVVDLSDAQLEQDRLAARHYNLEITIQHADMRDLSQLPRQHFDLVDQPYSINFVPDVLTVFQQVAQVLKPGGIYRFMCANPFAAGLTERDYDGSGYTLKRPYIQGERIVYNDQDWVYDQDKHAPISPPQEFRHTLSALVNGLYACGFVLQALTETGSYSADINAEPGTWDHFTAVIPPWFYLRAIYRPEQNGS